jgi:uncharacterized protein with PQ loop repeat
MTPQILDIVVVLLFLPVYHSITRTRNISRMTILLRFILLTALFIVVNAGTRPEDVKWLQAKATEEGVVATGTGLLYKG